MINQDILEWCKEDHGKFHAVLCDPPYELGFMGKSWDSTDISFNPATWKAIAQHLYPGAYLLAFGGTRTVHRIACAIEDAGFEIRDTVMWVYGSGFPKSHNVGKAVDKAEGNEREFVSKHKGMSPNMPEGAGTMRDDNWTPNEWVEVTKGNSPWEGYGTALKPSWEPIIVARLPLEGTVASNVLKYGSGALNIDGTRIPSEPVPVNKLEEWSGFGQKEKPDYIQEINTKGRWPANLLTDGSDEVVGMFPDTGKSQGGRIGKKAQGAVANVVAGKYEKGDPGFGDSGSSARFFKTCPLDTEENKRLFYSSKVSKRERDAGLEGFEEKQIEDNLSDTLREGGDRRVGRIMRNAHPCLKPIALTTYLAKLILPPKLDKPRRLLVPFAGAGSEVVGAIQAGWDEVVGVEQSKEYCDIAEARIKHWTRQETIL